MSDIQKISLAVISREDYKRDLAALSREIEQNDVEALQRRKNGFGAALHKYLRRVGKSIRLQ